jgi:hypothetical protein
VKKLILKLWRFVVVLGIVFYNVVLCLIVADDDDLIVVVVVVVLGDEDEDDDGWIWIIIKKIMIFLKTNYKKRKLELKIIKIGLILQWEN